ncbi:hypothetical protein DFQ28_008622, partial [Apophysomyces sp. BC1034]
SRPCKRCVTLGKADTCQDVKHKKRGRPKLRDRSSDLLDQDYNNTMMGTIQTPTFTMTTIPARPINNVQSIPTRIAFVHESGGTSGGGSGVDLSTPNSNNNIPQSNGTTTTDNYLKNHPLEKEQRMEKPQAITLFLSMEVCCARIPGEVMEMWGYYPQELVHRPFYDFISSKDVDRLAQLHRLLLDNITSVVKRGSRSSEQWQPPLAVRTTSDLFYDADPKSLATTACGSSRFSDTLHVKKRSGELELYEICMSLGGGLGADLSMASDLSKLYIIADMKKHQYKVTEETSHERDPVVTFQQATRKSTVALAPHSKTNTALHSFRIQGADDRTLSNLMKRPIFGARRNTSSLPNSPKVNVAPTTGQANHRRAQTSFATGIYRPTAANTIISGSTAGRVPIIREETHNPYSTMAYRSTPTSPRSRLTMFTHPSEQYYLQTSSSTLNAEASAIVLQKRGLSAGLAMMMTDNNRAVSTRKAEEMSIRSLLC